jgi:serine/threonine protein kinase
VQSFLDLLKRMSEKNSSSSACNFVSNDFINKSKEIQLLGSGTFGRVALYNTPLGKHVIKGSKIEHKSLGYPSDFLTEVDMLFKLRPIKTIVNIQGVCFDTDRKKGYIVLEQLDCNLSQWIKQTPFEQRIDQMYNIINHIGATIAMMHHFSFIHNDIKPNNILVKKHKKTGKYIFKLADFGSAVHVTDPSVHYCGLRQYLPPLATNIYKTEFWAFMISLAEVIVGYKLVIKEEEHTNFYRPYLSTTNLNRMKFDLSKYLESALDKERFQMIPDVFWTFIDPLINGQDVKISDCLSKIGIVLNINLINEVNKSISKAVRIHPRFSVVADEFKNRLKSIHLLRYFDKFSRLFNKFLSLIPDDQNLSDTDLKYYAEVAFVIVTRSKADRFRYFENLDTFLSFQRAFLIKIGYQIILL